MILKSESEGVQPLYNRPFTGRMKMSNSMASAQDPLAIAAQTMLQCPYLESGTLIIKLSYWIGNWHGDVLEIQR